MRQDGRVNRWTSGYERRVHAAPARSRHWPAALLVLVLGGACATTNPRPTPDAPRVVDLEIEGTDQLGEGDIKDRIVTTETPWWEPFNPFDDGPSYFDPNAWQADLRRIERFYQAHGYYQAAVVANEVQPRGPDAVALRAEVKEGEPTHIGDILVSGLEALPGEHQKLAVADLPLTKGAIFREADWDGVKELIQGRLREQGYAEAEVGGEVRVDVGTRLATVDIQAKPGQRYRFGSVFVATDARPEVPPRRIIEQAQGAVKKGEWYRESALSEAQARVFRMGVFGAVKVNRGAPDREEATVPVVVDVRESPFHSIRLGGGLGVDSNRQEVRTLGEWTHRNFLGGLRRLTVRGRVGYAFLPTVYAAEQNGVVFDATTEFEQPRFLWRDVRLQTSLNAERGLEPAYTFIGGRLRGGLIWQPHPALSIFPSYNLEVYRLTGDAGAGARVPPITLGCVRGNDSNAPCNIALSYLEQTIEWDRRDDRSEPRSGYYASLSLQEGGGPLQGSFTYVRLLPDVRYYHSFGPERRLTVAARLRLGTLIPLGEDKRSSIVTRFFSGGSSMRGFNSRRLSPQIAIEGQEETVPIGGNGLLETSLEVRYRLTNNLVVAGFYDTGFVTSERLGGLGGALGNDLQHAVGLGLRYLTVVGPLRLDIARRLNLRPSSLVVDAPPGFAPRPASCFFFKSDSTAYAGAPEDLCAFHISIGEAF